MATKKSKKSRLRDEDTIERAGVRTELPEAEARNPGTGKVPTPHEAVAIPTPRNDLPNPRLVRAQAKATRDRLKKIKPTRVVALERGYYNDRLYEEGEKFDMVIDPTIAPPQWVAVVKGKSKETPDEEFGPDEDDSHDEDKDTDDEDI